MDFPPLCIAFVEDTPDCFERMYDVGCLHFAGDIAKHDICADERDHFAALKPNVNVSRLMVVGINRDRVLSNPRYLRRASRITQDLGFVKKRKTTIMRVNTLTATPRQMFTARPSRRGSTTRRAVREPPARLDVSAQALVVTRGRDLERIEVQRLVGHDSLEPTILVFKRTHFGDVPAKGKARI